MLEGSDVLKLKEDKILSYFQNLDSWEDRYRVLIKIGKNLPQLAEEYRTETNQVKGCQSQVWIVASKDDSGKLNFQGDSDALLVRGLVALLIEYYSGLPAATVARLSPEFISKLGFSAHLTPSRANGLQAMIKQIRYFGIAFDAMEKSSLN